MSSQGKSSKSIIFFIVLNKYPTTIEIFFISLYRARNMWKILVDAALLDKDSDLSRLKKNFK